MATPSIQYITQLLDEPFSVSETDVDNIDSLTQVFPYFLPIRYVNAAMQHRKRIFNAPMMTTMQLHMGNWVLFAEFLNEALKRSDNKERIAPKIFIKKPETVEKFPLYDEEFMATSSTFPDDKGSKSYVPKDQIQEEPPVSVHVHYTTTENTEEENKIIYHTAPETGKVETEQDIVPNERLAEQEHDIVVQGYSEEEVNNEVAVSEHQELSFAAEDTTTTGQVEFEEPEMEGEAEAEYETPAKDEDEPYDNTRYIIEQINIPTTVKQPGKDMEQTLEEPAVEEVAAQEELILPVYTDDYFRHQGIEVSNEMPEEINEINKHTESAPEGGEEDKSLMVVMGFSDWLLKLKATNAKEKEEREDQKALKTMWQKEKLAAAIEEGNDEIPEMVFEMAVNSIMKEENLISEALAEIYEKQGKYDTAIDMYRKLSLRNPQKNAYFARKIEVLLKAK